MSGSGPLSPIFHGVWQSWQPDVETRYLPRATLSTVAPPEPWACAGKATNAVAATASPRIAYSRGMRRFMVCLLTGCEGGLQVVRNPALDQGNAFGVHH